MDKHYIKPGDWPKIYEALKVLKGIRVKSQERTRRFVEAVYSILRTGAQWRKLPPYYGHW